MINGKSAHSGSDKYTYHNKVLLDKVCDENMFTVKVEVDTFEGPHNDYFTEVMTFVVTPSEVTLKSYTHSDFVAS